MAINKRPTSEKWDQIFMRKSDPPYCLYEVDKKRGVATITFNKPERLNAATLGDLEEVRQKTIAAEVDEDVKVIIYNGAGDAFSSGIDLEWVAHAYGEKGERRLSQRYRFLRYQGLYGRPGLFQTVYACLKATMAQVHGYCYGTAFKLSNCCDITIASEDALFGNPAYKYVGGGLDDMNFLFQTIGVKRTKEIMLTGCALTAREALDYGLINHVVKSSRLTAKTNEIAEIIALQPSDATSMTKACLEAAQDIAGIGTAMIAGHNLATYQTNVQYQPGEFNLIKSLSSKGISGAIAQRERHYRKTPLRAGA